MCVVWWGLIHFLCRPFQNGRRCGVGPAPRARGRVRETSRARDKALWLRFREREAATCLVEKWFHRQKRPVFSASRGLLRPRRASPFHHAENNVFETSTLRPGGVRRGGRPPGECSRPPWLQARMGRALPSPRSATPRPSSAPSHSVGSRDARRCSRSLTGSFVSGL